MYSWAVLYWKGGKHRNYHIEVIEAESIREAIRIFGLKKDIHKIMSVSIII